MEDAARFRIGELSYRVGVSPDVLRAWEKRYGLLRPSRSGGGYRLYSDRDEWRVRLMQQKLWGGLSTAEAAREVLRMEEDTELPDGSVATPAELGRELGEALEGFDDERGHELLDLLLGLHGLERAIRDALMPYLADLGDRWARNQVSVAQEHFASRLIEARMLALARGWNRGPGHRAVLACPSGEEHTLPLVCFGLAMRNRGWRNVYLGADTPLSSVRLAADTVGADVVVLSAVTIDRFVPVERELAGLAASHRVVLAGRGAGAELAAQLDLECIHDDPVSAAEMLSRRLVLS
jgi:MerR family transcriptional regulator, light-induced transcriptional regulator